MHHQSLTVKRIFLNACLASTAALLLAAGASARTQDPAERQRAIDLYESNNFVAALPLLEKVALASPNDTTILARLGFALYANSAAEKDPARRKNMLDRARTVLQRSRSLGDKSNLTGMVLEGLSASGC